MTPCTHEAIDVGPTGNLNRTNFFLKTGRIFKLRKWAEYPITKQVINRVNKWGYKFKKTAYGTNLELTNHTKEKFEWDIEDDLYGLIDTGYARHPALAADFLGVLLEEDIPGSVDSVEAESIDGNSIATTDASNSDIVHTPGVCDDNDAPTPILTPISNPTPDANVDEESDYGGGGEVKDIDDYVIEQIEPP